MKNDILGSELERLAVVIEKKITKFPSRKNGVALLVSRKNMLEQGLAMSIFAHALDEVRGLKTYIYSMSGEDKNLIMYEAFQFSFFSKNGVSKILILLRASLIFLHQIFFLFSFSRMRFDFEKYVREATYKGIPIGDLVYDSYVRNDLTFLHLYSDFIKFFKIAAKLSYILCHSEGVIRRIKPECILTSHIFYASSEASLTRIGLKYGIPVYVIYTSYVKKLTVLEDALKSPHIPNKSELDAFDNSNVDSEFEQYWKGRSAGISNHADSHDVKNAYLNKKSIKSKSDFLGACGVTDYNKHNVIVVAPHAFSDVCRGAGKSAYLDYYQWFLRTLDFAKLDNNSYWLFKPHPSSYMYGEEGVVEKAIKEHENNHIKLVPEFISTKTVFEYADLILTVRGTIALEASAHGVPVIQAGESPWTEYLDILVADTHADYERFLKGFKKNANVNPERTKKAKTFMLWYLRDRVTNSQILPTDSIGIVPNMDKQVVNDIYTDKIKTATAGIENSGLYSDSLYKHYKKILNGELIR